MESLFECLFTAKNNVQSVCHGDVSRIYKVNGFRRRVIEREVTRTARGGRAKGCNLHGDHREGLHNARCLAEMVLSKNTTEYS